MSDGERVHPLPAAAVLGALQTAAASLAEAAAGDPAAAAGHRLVSGLHLEAVLARMAGGTPSPQDGQEDDRPEPTAGGDARPARAPVSGAALLLDRRDAVTIDLAAELTRTGLLRAAAAASAEALGRTIGELRLAGLPAAHDAAVTRLVVTAGPSLRERACRC